MLKLLSAVGIAPLNRCGGCIQSARHYWRSCCPSARASRRSSSEGTKSVLFVIHATHRQDRSDSCQRRSGDEEFVRIQATQNVQLAPHCSRTAMNINQHRNATLSQFNLAQDVELRTTGAAIISPSLTIFSTSGVALAAATAAAAPPSFLPAAPVLDPLLGTHLTAVAMPCAVVAG